MLVTTPKEEETIKDKGDYLLDKSSIFTFAILQLQWKSLYSMLLSLRHTIMCLFLFSQTQLTAKEGRCWRALPSQDCHGERKIYIIKLYKSIRLFLEFLNVLDSGNKRLQKRWHLMELILSHIYLPKEKFN